MSGECVTHKSRKPPLFSPFEIFPSSKHFSLFCVAGRACHYALDTPCCPLYNLHYTMHTTQTACWKLLTAHCTMHTGHSTLNTKHWKLHTENYLLHAAHCLLQDSYIIVHCTLCSAHCQTAYWPMRTSHFTLHTVHCTLYNTHISLHTAHCTLHTAHYTLNTAHCILHTAHLSTKSVPPHRRLRPRLPAHVKRECSAVSLRVTICPALLYVLHTPEMQKRQIGMA